MIMMVDEQKGALEVRNALQDHDAVESDLAAQGSAGELPVVTIAIPTYRRPGLLVQAVRSAMNQRFDRPVEILVLDNDPGSSGPTELMDALPELRGRNFRYFVNRENIGMFGNWNRCIQLARGEWLTILNDDDLLDPDCLRIMFQVLDRKPEIDALTCLKRAVRENGETITDAAGPLPRRLARRMLRESLFMGRLTRRIRPRKFFWGSLFGNSAGFLVRTQKAAEIGGFYPEDFPSADYSFYLRLSRVADFRELRVVAASIRIGDNETANPDTVRKSLEKSRRLQQSLLGTDVPRWWAPFSPMVVARDWTDYRNYWGVHIPKEEVESRLGIRLPPHRPRLLWLLRFLLRGY
jgi:glycosyltransferase involved in cell wall biosynthesis